MFVTRFCKHRMQYVYLLHDTCILQYTAYAEYMQWLLHSEWKGTPSMSTCHPLQYTVPAAHCSTQNIQHVYLLHTVCSKLYMLHTTVVKNTRGTSRYQFHAAVLCRRSMPTGWTLDQPLQQVYLRHIAVDKGCRILFVAYCNTQRMLYVYRVHTTVCRQRMQHVYLMHSICTAHSKYILMCCSPHSAVVRSWYVYNYYSWKYTHALIHRKRLPRVGAGLV